MAIGGNWYDTLDLIGRAQFTDLLVPATRPRVGAGAEVTLSFAEVYLRMTTGLVRLASLANYGGLAIGPVGALDGPRTGPPDEPGTVLAVSLASSYFGDLDTVRCGTVNYVTNAESDLARGIVRCVELAISGEQRIFFDPVGGGIRIGHAGAFGVWLSNRGNRSPAMQRHTWTSRG